MGSAVLKFLSLAIIFIMIIDGVLCHEEGKSPTTGEYSRKSLISEHHLSSCLNLPDNDVHMWQSLIEFKIIPLRISFDSL